MDAVSGSVRLLLRFVFPVLVAISPALAHDKRSGEFNWPARLVVLVAIILLSLWNAVIGLLSVILLLSFFIVSSDNASVEDTNVQGLGYKTALRTKKKLKSTEE